MLTDAHLAEDVRPATGPAAPASRRTAGGVIAIAVLGLTVLVLGVPAAVDAFFTSEARVEGQHVGTATVEVSADIHDGFSGVAVDDMLPGDSATTFIEVVNTGDVELYYSFRVVPDDDADATLAETLAVSLTVPGGPAREAALADWNGGRLTAATALAPGDTIAVLVMTSLPLEADHELQGRTAGFGIAVDAIQTRHVDQPGDGWVVEG